MSTFPSAAPRNVHNQSSAAPVPVTTPDDAFRELWLHAVLNLQKNASRDVAQWKSAIQRMDQCRDAEDVCRVLDDMMSSIETFRGTDTIWGKLRNKYLKPVIDVLLLFNDVIGETAASFVCYPSSSIRSVSHHDKAQYTWWEGGVHGIWGCSSSTCASPEPYQLCLQLRLGDQGRERLL